MKRKLWAALVCVLALSVLMLAGLFPVNAFAANGWYNVTVYSTPGEGGAGNADPRLCR